MKEIIDKQLTIGDWCFEVKMVRAYKMSNNTEPYAAVATCNINGSSMYIDGLLTQKNDEFTKEDFMTFYQFSQQLGLEEFTYQRYHNGESSTKVVAVGQQNSRDSLKENDNVISLTETRPSKKT